MKKALLLGMVGIASLFLGQAASAAVTVVNGTDQKIFVYDMGGFMHVLHPNQYADCSYNQCSKFNVLVKNSMGKKVTVCTITPVTDGGTVRVTHILNNKVNGGCYSYYQYLQ